MRYSRFGPIFSVFVLCSTLQGQKIVPELIPVWTRLGDSAGAVDEEHDIASVESAEFSPGDSLIASGAKKDGSVRVWRVAGDSDAGPIWTQYHENDPENEVEVVAWTRDGKYVLSGGEDWRVRVWRASDGEPVTVLNHIASIDGMRFSHSGGLLATGDEAGQVNIWDTSDPDPLNWPATPLYIVEHGPDQNRPGGGTGHSDVNSIDWTKDDRFIVTAGRNMVVKRWEVAQLDSADQGLRMTYSGFASSIKSVRLSPDGKYVASGAKNSTVKIWTFDDGALVTTFTISEPDVTMEAVEFSPDGQFLITGGTEGKYSHAGMGNIRFYRVPRDPGDNYELVLTEPVFRQEYFHFNSDGSLLVSSHEDGTLRLWQVSLVELPPEIFSNVLSESGMVYLATLRVGSKYYVDRTYTITALPEDLNRAWFIMTSDYDKTAASDAFLTFDLLQDATVYVAYDPRATSLPDWLSDWDSNDEKIWTTALDTDHLNLFSKNYSAGQVILGGNLASGASGGLSNYIVAAVATGGAVGISDESFHRASPEEFMVHGIYPNPFNATANVLYDLQSPAKVSVTLFDLLGEQVLIVPAQWKTAGGGQIIRINGSQLASGIYLYRVSAWSANEQHVRTGRMLLLK